MIKKYAYQYLKLSFGVLLVAVSFYFFLNSNKLVAGGITGIATLLDQTNIPLPISTIIFIGNMFCLSLGFLILGKSFAVKSLYGSILLPFYVFIFEACKIPTDILFTFNSTATQLGPLSVILVSVVSGGILLAIGLGICFRNNASTGGMDIIQKIIERKLHVPLSYAIYVTDGVIVLIGALVFGFELGFYAIILIYIFAQTIDHVSMGGKSRRTAYIISEHAEIIKEEIYKQLERGVTECSVLGGYSQKEFTMLICTLTKYESYILRDLIQRIDSKAFTFFSQTKEVEGDGF